MNIQSFQHVAPPLRLFHGEDSLDRLGREIERLGAQRAVILCGASVAAGGLAEAVASRLGERCAGTFSGVRAHSPRQAVEEAAARLKDLEADAVVAIGGGSAIVTARAAGILAAEAGDLASLSTSVDAEGRLHSPRLVSPKLPQLLVPTSPTTAAVKAGAAVFDPDGRKRLALFDPKIRAHSIHIHPEMLMSAPRKLVVSAGLDTLCLAVEGLTARSGDAISDALLIHAVRLLAGRLSRIAEADGAELRSDLMMAAVLCGRGTEYTGGGVATVLGHAIGAAYQTENGVTKAVVLPHALAFNAEAAAAGLGKLAVALDLRPAEGGAVAGMVIQALSALFAGLEVPTGLRDLGVPQDALADIAGRGMADWFLRGNARKVSEPAELQQVLEDAW